MQAMETELEQAPKESVDRRAEASPRSNVRPVREHEERPFSPDPMEPTDRYRLVTPYRLSRDD